jgi:DNA modification methylase
MKLNIKEIKLNDHNPRDITPEMFEKLKKSIQEFPQMLETRPLVIDENNVVLGGNMRLRALTDLGYEEIPVQKVEGWSEEQKKEFIVKDNVSYGVWDWELLANSWDAEQLGDWGLEVPGWEKEELEAQEDNFEVPDEIQTDIQLGDIIEIGEHRLMCGDSTCSDTVAKLMNGEKSELLFTSPPYSDMRTYNGDKDLSINNLIEFIPTFLPFAEYQVVNLGIQRKDNEIVQYWDSYIQKAKDCGYKLLSWNVWNRESATSIGLQTAFFPIFHEWIFVFGSGSTEINRTKPKSEASYERQKYKPGTRRNKKGELKVPSKENISYDLVKIGTVTTLKAANTIGESTHPAMFPVELPSEYIKAMTNEGQIVTEPFLGSGSTMVACHQLNRKCYGMELDPKYCQVIVDRMIKLDLELVIKKNGELYISGN